MVNSFSWDRLSGMYTSDWLAALLPLYASLTQFLVFSSICVMVGTLDFTCSVGFSHEFAF